MIGFSRFSRSFSADKAGGIVPMAAAGVPVVALLAIAGAELASLSTEKGRMQDVADAVVLDAANQLSFSSPQSVLARAEANARGQLASMEPRTTLTIKAELVEDGKGVKVAVNGVRLSFFGNMLPPGGFKTAVQSTAVAMNTAPLCIVAVDAAKRLKTDNTAQVDAGECLVHGNGEVETAGASRLRAYSIQAGRTAKGSGMTPAALVGAALIADPFAGEALPVASGCTDNNKKFDKLGAASWCAGRHTGHIDAEGTEITLAPGVHVFNGEVQLKKGTTLRGEDVVLVFEQGAKFTIDDASVRIDLQGRRSGTQSGFVFVSGPTRTSQIDLPAKQLVRLEGVVYARNAKLRIGAFGRGDDDEDDDDDEGASAGPPAMARQSKWTVIIAPEIEVRDDVTMVVNTDYLASNVPVPAGVGDKVGVKVRLAR